MTELNLILVGPPGAGKGTQGRKLEGDFRLPYIATGDIVRAAIQEESELGRKAKEYNDRGDLVPDEVMIDVIRERLVQDDSRDGFILDGFPRTIPQAEALDAQLEELDRSLTAVLMFDVPDEEILRRVSGRRSCVKNGHVYNVHYDPPKREGVCDQDGSRLVQREDDEEQKVRHRLEVYRRETEPLGDYYERNGVVLRRFEGDRSPTEVHDHIRATLATLRLEDEV
jgi:adenylate kinase